jgi:hypothetical protein
MCCTNLDIQLQEGVMGTQAEDLFGVWYAKQWQNMDVLGLIASIGIWAASASAKRAAVISSWNVQLRYVFVAVCILLVLLLFLRNKVYLQVRERAFIFLCGPSLPLPMILVRLPPLPPRWIGHGPGRNASQFVI